jgi:lipoate-protein ligase B
MDAVEINLLHTNPLPYSMIDAIDFQKFARVLVSTVETTIIRTVSQ